MGFVAVEGLGANVAVVYDGEGVELERLDMPFEDEVYNPKVATSAAGDVVVVGVPCGEWIDDDGFVECQPGGLSAAVLSIGERSWTAVADRLSDDAGTQGTYAAGIAADAAIVGVGRKLYAIPLNGEATERLPDLPFRPTEGLCVSGDDLLAVRMNGAAGEEPEPGTGGASPEEDISPVRAARMDVVYRTWEELVVTESVYDPVDAFTVGCTSSGVFATPWSPSVTPSAPHVTHWLSPDGDVVQQEPIPEGSGVVRQVASVDGSVTLAQTAGPTVLELTADGRWVARERGDDLTGDLWQMARHEDRYIAVDDTGHVTTGEFP